ncbi:hypothetical protein HUW51_17405 [Adhaeribacter swui]|uniref:Cyclic GMP-AMP synthase n=1 Tax=Adhaeribacter swui TaxID=2086471 RepID=A0A7G7GB79_9BACT|nr:hypothetical protein [Adhaeribacter swui]QNF34413.1 hypothetical protein HUW51_17405 [Adhaeribacter swui]
MANCHDLFLDFNSTIRLSESKRKSLKLSRHELRRKIRRYFKENEKDGIMPKFSGQGSFMMDSIINPIPRKEIEGNTVKYLYFYDIDDGIYFIGNLETKTRYSIQTYHNWIYDAVDGHTDTPPIDKNTCVRVLFSDGHNIDLPIYYKQGDTPELAHKAKSWLESDPLKFSQWFNEKAEINPQLRRIVRYLKTWSDYRQYCNTSKPMPSGLILTILAANHYYRHDRDDISLKETLVSIEAALRVNFRCERPTTPAGENLLSKYTQEEYFMGSLRQFISNAKLAIEEKNQKKGCEYWQKSLGDRFPCHLAKDEEQRNIAVSGLVMGAANSKPYGTII